MHHKSGKHDLQEDLHHLVDAVVPRVESAVTTVAEKTPPLVDRGRAVAGTVADRGRTMAIEKGSLLAERLPDSVVERLPDKVTDQLPVKTGGKGKKLLLVGLLAALAAAGAAFVRRSKAGPSTLKAATTPSAYPAGTASQERTDAPAPNPAADPSDPLTESSVNGRGTLS